MGLLNKKNINNVNTEKSFNYGHFIHNVGHFIFLGNTETNLEEGSKWSPLINGKTIEPNIGSIVISNGEEFIYTTNGWKKLGWNSQPISVPEDMIAPYSNIAIDTCSRIN